MTWRRRTDEMGRSSALGTQGPGGPSRPRGDVTIDLRGLPRVVARTLIISIAVLVVLHGLTVYLQQSVDIGSIEGAGTFVRLFTLNDELAIPAWFASLMIFLAGAAVALVGAVRGRARRSERWRWFALAAILVFLSADEMASIHEVLTAPLQRALDLPGFLYYAWVIPYAVFALAVAVMSIGLLRTLPAPVRNRILLAGAIFVGGALGMEMVGAAVLSAGYEETLWYRLTHTIEEIGELVGMALFLHTVVRHLVTLVPEVALAHAEDGSDVLAHSA